MRDDRERLLDIQEAIVRVEKYAGRGQQVFEQEELIQNWIIHHLQIIGEASRALSPAFQQQHADWPWAQIIGMRNILVHNYFQIDTAIVWTVVANDLPDLRRKVEDALQQLPAQPSP